MCLLPVSLTAQTADLAPMLRSVETRYNHAQTLQVLFHEAYTAPGQPRRAEGGTLLLRKPGRMRWDYTYPRTKLFVLDGKYAWFYAQGDQQVQRLPAKQLDDLRSPLRFLLGHTQLEKELTHLTVAPVANGAYTLTGQLKDQEKRVPRLALTVTPDGAITGIEIEEADGAITRFAFTNQQINAPAPAGAFHFTPPPGIPIVDAPPPV